MKAITCKGKHAEICREISTRHRDDAMQLIYAFFRSEENTDSYSIQLLTILRELLEDGDSDELYRLRIRMRSNGDRVLINLAQFIWALDAGKYDEAAETLAEKCLADMPKLSRSMQDFVDEEGLSPASDMAGQRIREAVKIIRDYFDSQDNEEAVNRLDDLNLEMSRIFLFTHEELIAEDMKKAALSAQRQGDDLKCYRICREIVRSYDPVLTASDGSDSRLKGLREIVEYARNFVNTKEAEET